MTQTTRDATFRAERAAVLIDELGPTFARIEATYYEAMFGFDRVTADGNARVVECLRMIEAVRRLKGDLQAEIVRGQSKALSDQKGATRTVA